MPPMRHVTVPSITSMVCVKYALFAAMARRLEPAAPLDVLLAMTVVVVRVVLNT